jgi:hypothetical protein
MARKHCIAAHRRTRVGVRSLLQMLTAEPGTQLTASGAFVATSTRPALNSDNALKPGYAGSFALRGMSP